jgi:hypothetical protein
MTVSLGYSARKTKMAIWQAIKANGYMVADLVQLPEDDSDGLTWNTKLKAYVFKNWVIGFSGQTQRDIEGIDTHGYR